MKPRYHTAEEIEKLIDSKLTMAKALEVEAWEYERKAKEWIEASAKTKNDAELGECISEHHECVKISKRKKRRAECILDNHLPKLKAKLAEFNTPQIPVIDNGDVSVPVG